MLSIREKESCFSLVRVLETDGMAFPNKYLSFVIIKLNAATFCDIIYADKGDHNVSGKDAMKIAIVDDDRDDAEMLKLMLEAEGFANIAVFDCPQIALGEINETVSVLISDFNMPYMDGIKFLDIIGQKHQGIKGAIITGNRSGVQAISNKYPIFEKANSQSMLSLHAWVKDISLA